jgi:hypothetical protein
MGNPVGRIFLSYRREDTRHMAGRLADRLKARFGTVQVFMDVDAIEPGADFIRAIASEVGSCDLLIALIGPQWLAVDERLGRPRLHLHDDFVALEIRTALERGIHVIPVLVDEAKMPTARDLPDALRGLATRNAVRLDHETFGSDVGRLLSAVERILPTLPVESTDRQNRHPPSGAAPTPRPASGRHSYGPNPPVGEEMSGPSAADQTQEKISPRPLHKEIGHKASRRLIILLVGVGVSVAAIMLIVWSQAQSEGSAFRSQHPTASQPSVSQSTSVEPSLAVDPDTVAVGEAYTLQGSGFPPNTPVTIYYRYNDDSSRPNRGQSLLYGTYTTDSGGSFSFPSRAVTQQDCDEFPVQMIATIDRGGPAPDPVATATVKVCPST